MSKSHTDFSGSIPKEIIRALAEELEAEFGPAPFRVPLRELVFTGTAPE
jgi:hypothetical protein